jgi:hypothetical protein
VCRSKVGWKSGPWSSLSKSTKSTRAPLKADKTTAEYEPIPTEKSTSVAIPAGDVFGSAVRRRPVFNAFSTNPSNPSASISNHGAKPFVEKTGINSKNAGERLWLRVERQTLRKLKRTGAILFTIRIYIDPLKEIVKFEGVAKRLNKALSVLPLEMQAYKQSNTFSDSVQKYLDQFWTIMDE